MKTGITIELIQQESGNNMKARKIRIPESNREKLQLFAKRAVSSYSCTIKTKRPISGRANPGASESDLVSVCVKGKARAYKQCAQNNNKNNCRYKINK